MANIKKFYWYSLLIWATFWQPVIVIFWLENGLSMSQVFAIRSIHSIAIIFLEAPTGAIADYLGKRKTLFWATLLYMGSLGFYVFGETFWVFVLAELVAAVGTSLVSGSDSAFIYDSLLAENKETQFTEVMGKSSSLQLISQAVSSIVGGFIGAFSNRFTFIVSLLPTLGGVGIAYTFQEPQISTDEAPKKWWEILRNGFMFVATNKPIRWLVMFISLITAFDLCVLWLYQPYMQESGLPLAFFGFAMASFNLTAAVASRYAQNIANIFSKSQVLILLPLLMILSIFSMANIMFPLSFLLICGLQVVRGVRGPILYKDFLAQAAPGERATVLSVVSLITRLTFVIISPFVGWIVDNQTMTSALNFIGITMLICFAVMAIWYRFSFNINQPPNSSA